MGGDYLLSATANTEFTPRRYRSRMLAWLFLMEPFGHFFASGVAAVVTTSFQSRMQCQYIGYSKSSEDLRAVDRSRRLIVGIGGLPAISAIIIRSQIPESPRYTLDVILAGGKALDDTTIFYLAVDGNNIPTKGAINRRHGGVIVGRLKNADQKRRGIIDHPSYDFFSEIGGPVSGPVFRTEGNWIHLTGTMVAWGPLHAAFYGLGFSSSGTVQKLWDDSSTAMPSTLTPSTAPCPVTTIGTGSTISFTLKGNAWHPMVIVSLQAFLGGLTIIHVIQHSQPDIVQNLFFSILTILFFIVRGLFQVLFNNGRGNQHKGLVAFYCFCHFFFNLGPNATTLIVVQQTSS